MSHAGYPFVEEAIFVVMRNKNVYMDLSEYELAPMADRYVEALNKGWIDKKVVFASAHPFVEQSAAIKIYNEMPISDEVRARVFWDNAARLLKLA
jgi:predicted TIM-barrel fold metal-dependent hydrolase